MIPLPIRAELPGHRFPAMTTTLIAMNTLAWLYELHHGVGLSTLDYGMIPSWILGGIRDGPIYLPGVGRAVLHQEVPFPWTLLTAMFMHGGWLHILSNMWFLWVFGDGIEGAMGGLKFLTFYLLSGLVAAGAQVLATPASAEPMVGASGAIAGVLGAYLVLYPRTRIRCLWVLIVFITFVNIPAWVLLALWFLSQFFVPVQAGIAWMAHVGGFLAGLLFARFFVSHLRPAFRR